MSRGPETLLALRASAPAALQKAEKRLHSLYPNELYGEGGQDLAAATVCALERTSACLASAGAACGALLEPRLEAIEGAVNVYDFGALSYANAAVQAKAEKLVQRAMNKRQNSGAAALALAQVQAALRCVGADIAVNCVELGGGTTLLLCGTAKGCWLRAVSGTESPALWLLDMIRRTALGLKQAEGTQRQRYRAKLCLPKAQPAAAAPVSPAGAQKPPTPEPTATAAAAVPKQRHTLRRVLALFALALLLGLAGAWYMTGGDLAALPQTLGLQTQPHSGAVLI